MPKHKSLAEIEAEMRREQRGAERFVEKQGVGSLPGPRSETGESDELQRSGGKGRVDDGLDAGDITRKGGTSYSFFGTIDDWEQAMAEGGKAYTPLVGGNAAHPTIRSLEKRSRMNHVFTFMRPERVELLYWRHIEGMTLGDIAAQEQVSRQAIAKRLAVAEADFMEAFAAHWNDDITWEV